MQTNRTAASSSSSIFLYIFAILLPPVAVFLTTGCSVDFIINICLTILAWIPGILHAWWVIARSGRVVTAAPAAPLAPATAAPVTTAMPATGPGAPATAAGPTSVNPGMMQHAQI